MTTQAKVIIGGLATVVVVLSIALGVALASNDDDGMRHMNFDGNGYMSMMQAMGNMDSDEMLAQMERILGAEDYQRMLDHIAEHRRGGGMAGQGMDGMMHQMMDGMMQQMPADRYNVMPMMPR
ncbi:MAG: hypothetical protein GEU75_16680 [Dehalococcoidia bacterium]|nr:hypothetical protein [Dehalococcoidia bacterium]